MPIEFVSSAVLPFPSGGASLTVTGLQSGDTVLVFGASNNATPPSVPTRFTNIGSHARTGSSGYSMRAAYTVSTGTSVTVPAWTTTTHGVVAIAYRGVTEVGDMAGANGSSASATVPGLSLSGSAWVASAVTTQSASVGVPSGMAGRVGGGGPHGFDTDGAVQSFAARTAALGFSAGWGAVSVALYSDETHSFEGSQAGQHLQVGTFTATENAATAGSQAAQGGTSTWTVTEGETHSFTGTQAGQHLQVGTFTISDRLTFTGTQTGQHLQTSTWTAREHPEMAGAQGGHTERGRFLAPPTPRTITPPPRDLDTLIASSAPRRARADIIAGPATGQSLPVTDGTVTVDYAADIRRAASVTVAGLPEWEPADATHALDLRAGTEIKLWQGVVDDLGVTHWWSQGVYGIARPSVARSSNGLDINLDLTDRAHRVKLAGIRRRWAATGNDRILASIITVLGEVAPWLPINIDTTDDLQFGTDAVIAEYGDDVWAKCRDLARSMSRDLHIDRDGVCVAPLVVDPLTAAPVPLIGLLAETVDTDTEDVVNVIGCPWEEARPDDAPEDWVPKGGIEEAVDPSSSTGIGSALGVRARAFDGDTSVVHTPEHARLAAQYGLTIRLGLQQAAAGSVVPDPRLDVGIPVDVHGTTHIVSRLSISLTGGETSIDMGASRPDIALMMAAMTRPPGEYRTTEIVTGLAPLRSRPVTEPSGAETSVQWTDALAGVEVGDPITVLHKGAGHRVGVALLVKKPLAKAHAGEKVARIAGTDLDVGDDVTFRVKQGSANVAFTQTSAGTVTAELPVPQAGASSYWHTVPAYNVTWGGGAMVTRADAGSVTLQAINDNRHTINALVNTVTSIYNRLTSGSATSQPQG